MAILRWEFLLTLQYGHSGEDQITSDVWLVTNVSGVNTLVDSIGLARGHVGLEIGLEMLYPRVVRMNIGMMFKWATPPKDDPIGLVVSLDSNGELVIGNSNIIGVVGGTPEILLNNPDEWGDKYVIDDFLRRQKYTHKGKEAYVTADNYNPNKSYQKRSRKRRLGSCHNSRDRHRKVGKAH